MSWYKQSLRMTRPVEHAQQIMEDNGEDIEYLATVLRRYREIEQDLEFINEMVGFGGEKSEDAEDIMTLKTEIEQLKNIWNNYSETLRNFALFKVHNEEL